MLDGTFITGDRLVVLRDVKIVRDVVAQMYYQRCHHHCRGFKTRGPGVYWTAASNFIKGLINVFHASGSTEEFLVHKARYRLSSTTYCRLAAALKLRCCFIKNTKFLYFLWLYSFHKNIQILIDIATHNPLFSFTVSSAY